MFESFALNTGHFIATVDNNSVILDSGRRWLLGPKNAQRSEKNTAGKNDKSEEVTFREVIDKAG